MSHKPHHTPEHHESPDAWHLHSPEEGQPQAEHGGKTNVTVLLVAFLTSFGFVAVVILVSYLYFQVHMTSKKQALIESTALSAGHQAYKKSTAQKLQGYSFVTEAAARAGAVSVPLEQAKQNVIAKYGSGGGKN